MLTPLIILLHLLVKYYSSQQTPHLGLTEAQTYNLMFESCFPKICNLDAPLSFTGQPNANNSGGRGQGPLKHKFRISFLFLGFQNFLI